MPCCLTTLIATLSRIDTHVDNHLQARAAKKQALKDKRIREKRWKELYKKQEHRESPRSGECGRSIKEHVEGERIKMSVRKGNLRQESRRARKKENVQMEKAVPPIRSTRTSGLVPAAVEFYRGQY